MVNKNFVELLFEKINKIPYPETPQKGIENCRNIEKELFVKYRKALNLTFSTPISKFIQ